MQAEKRTYQASDARLREYLILQIKMHQVGTGTDAIPNRNKATPEITLSKPVIPSALNEQTPIVSHSTILW
tara:strand:- start:13100 stop:13312 length:213 start_codon:yes stop_codon:yes gene_type:complete